MISPKPLGGEQKGQRSGDRDIGPRGTAAKPIFEPFCMKKVNLFSWGFTFFKKVNPQNLCVPWGQRVVLKGAITHPRVTPWWLGAEGRERPQVSLLVHLVPPSLSPVVPPHVPPCPLKLLYVSLPHPLLVPPTFPLSVPTAHSSLSPDTPPSAFVPSSIPPKLQCPSPSPGVHPSVPPCPHSVPPCPHTLPPCTHHVPPRLPSAPQYAGWGGTRWGRDRGDRQSSPPSAPHP